MNAERATRFPIGAAATIDELERDPHPLLARLREREPVSWLPVLDGWLAGLVRLDRRGGDRDHGRPASGARGRAFERLRESVERVFGRDPESSLVAAAAADGDGLSGGEVVSNAAVLLFGGIETTEGMIANAVLHVLANPEQRALLERDPDLVGAAVEESLRLEPAAAVVDRYTTREVELGGARIGERELVTVSLAGANRDPVVFAEPDRFDLSRDTNRLHVTFAHGPHVCIGMHLARLEALAAHERLLARLPGIRLDPDRPSAPHGLVFRKPPTLWASWDAVR